MNRRSAVLMIVAALVGQVEVESGGQHYVLAAGQKKTFADKSNPGKVKPDFTGTISEVSGNSLTITAPPTKKGGQPTSKQFKFTDQTKFTYFGVAKDAEKPTVGYRASVWLVAGSEDTAARVQLGLKQTILDGVIASVADDGKSFTFKRKGKGGTELSISLQIAENAKVVYRDAAKGNKPTAGYFFRAWLKPGSSDTASGLVFSSKSIDPPSGKKGVKVSKKPSLGGTVKALTEGGKGFTLELPPKQKGGQPTTIDIKVGENATIMSGKEAGKLAVGQFVFVGLEPGSTNVAKDVLIVQKKPMVDAKPSLGGVIKTLAKDGKRFALEMPPKKKGDEPTTIDIKVGENAKITSGKTPANLAVGLTAYVWLEKGSDNVARAIIVSKSAEKAKPARKPATEAKEPVQGVIKALSDGGKSVKVKVPPTKKGGQPTLLDVKIVEGTKITNGKRAGKLAAGLTVTVWLQEGSGNIAQAIQIGTPVEPVKKVRKTAPPEEEKPKEPRKPKEPPKPVRNPAPTAALIDSEIDRHLKGEKIPASPRADDAEFLRRVSLDLTGRIPTLKRTQEFLASNAPDKRRKLIDELLSSPEYGKHFATIWSNLIGASQPMKGGNNSFPQWLADEFNDNRSWSGLVTDLLTASGPIKDNPATTFLLANGEGFQPRPNIVAGSAARLFLGVNLRCAECHNHPFAPWKQADFWGTAAFFGKLQFTGFKGKGGAILTESNSPAGMRKGKTSVPFAGTAIKIPPEAGKASGKFVKARFPGGEEPALDEKEPFRPKFAAWATSADNPFFARAAVNRMWAHFFGRGFVNPLDGFDETNPPSHPVLLQRLAREFSSTGFDLKHLARCITSSKAYQRSSRSVAGKEADKSAFSHMGLKVLTAEMFYDSLVVVTSSDKSDPVVTKGGKTNGKKFVVVGRKGKKFGGGFPGREEFARYFRANSETDPTEYVQGIPQFLRLMNAPLLNQGAPLVAKLSASESSQAEAIETLYLAVLSRKPTAEEAKLMTVYLSRRKDAAEGYSGVLWILLNSSEFAINH